MKVFERIRIYIESNGVVLKHVAEKSGINLKRFYRLMDGTSQMTTEEYERICRIGLRIDPGYFFKEKISENEKKPA